MSDSKRLDMCFLLKYIRRELLEILALPIDKRDAMRIRLVADAVFVISDAAEAIPDSKAILLVDDFVNTVQHIRIADFKVTIPSEKEIEEAFS